MKMNGPSPLLLLALLLPGFIACKKTNPAAPGTTPTGLTTYTPNFISEHQPAASMLNGQFVIYDLNHDDNKDKQYFVVSLIKSGTGFSDSAQVLQAPQSIEKLAPGWPTAVKSAAFGKTLNIITDAKNSVVSLYGNAWQYGPMSTSTNVYRKLNDPEYAGAMAGKKPYGNNPMREQYTPGPSYIDYKGLYRDITYYFKDGMYTSNASGIPAKPFDSLFTGATSIDWKTIDQTVKADIEDPVTHIRYFTKFFYFDWTNWRYFVVDETEATALYLSYPPVYYIKFNPRGPYSLNKFCQWPAGWGKK